MQKALVEHPRQKQDFNKVEVLPEDSTREQKAQKEGKKNGFQEHRLHIWTNLKWK